jgi:hypothetical protein
METKASDFPARSRKARYGDYLSAFSMFSSGATVGIAQIPVEPDLRFAYAIAAQDAKKGNLRSLTEYEAEVERLQRLTAEASDGSSYGGSTSE